MASVANMGTALNLLRSPFTFTQSGPMRTSELIRAARRFDLNLNPDVLRILHESGNLAPLVVLTDSVVSPPTPPVDEPPIPNSTVIDLRRAQETGRLYDPTTMQPPANEPLIFEERRMSNPRGWWNGLLYSRWQLLSARRLRRVANEHPNSEPDMNDEGLRERAVALTVTLLEARYLPEVEPGWNRLRGVDDEEWFAWRASYDPQQQVDLLRTVDLTLDDVHGFAEGLLVQASFIDPTGQWGALIRRAPAKKWESTKGNLALAMEQRLAAEILLKFYSDAGGDRHVRPSGGSRVWHPLNDRVSDRKEPVSRLLMRLGVCAYPGAILVVEGETEELLAKRILDEIGLDDAAELVQIVTTRGVDKNLHLLAAATVAPVLGDRHPDAYDLLRPPCHLIAVVDPEGKYATPEKVERERGKVTKAIIEVVRTQRSDADTQELDSLVELRTWSGGTFEFTHFTDAELLNAIKTVHTEPTARPGDTQLLATIKHARSRGHDLKSVWRNWAHSPRKPELAEALWDVLRAKIQEALGSGQPLPELASAVHAAHGRARINSQGSWVIGVRDELR